MATDGYYRLPTINKRRVIFVCEDDLWEVSTRGGTPRRLTANLGRVSHPVASPNGRQLAFIGREDGENEVYVMPMSGGPAKRITFLGSETIVLGWTPDSKNIIFCSNARQPFRSQMMPYTISPKGGQPELLPYGPVRAISYGPTGGVVLGRRATDLANWKRYRGGTKGDFWIDEKGKGNFELLLKDLDGNMACPMWIDKRIYFLSDHEGIANIYSVTPSGDDIQRHTHHNDFYVRNPSTDGTQIVYRAGADLYVFNPTSKDDPTKVNIRWNSSQTQRNRKFVSPISYLDHYSLHPKGHSVAFNTRGKSFTMSNWEGAALQQGQQHGVRYRLTQWLNDGRRLVMVSDAGGEEGIEIHAPTPAGTYQVKRLADLDIGRPLFLSVSPTEDAIIFGNHRYELMHIDLKSGNLQQLDRSDYGRIRQASWSPDGRWVAYNFSTSLTTAAIKLYNLEANETYFITPPNRMYDFYPNFDPEGKYLYFISIRDFNPVHDSHYFEFGFPMGVRPYLITLQKDLPNPFIPLPNGAPPANKNQNEPNQDAQKEKDKKKKGKDEEPTSESPRQPPPLMIDLEGIQQRIVAFPLSEGKYYQIEGISKGRVLFTSYPIEGLLNDNDAKDSTPKGIIEMYDLVERRTEYIAGGLFSFKPSRDYNHIIYRTAKNLRVLKAGEKPDASASGFSKRSGWVKLSRARVAIQPLEEWQQMFREAWRLQRDHFWTEDMSAVDWQLIYERYYPLIERVATRSEFSDLMWEMQGELGTSHAYEMGGDYRPAPRYFQGFLGADFTYDPDAKGYRITHIVQGDSWLEKIDSPLNRLGVNAQINDLLVAIDGQMLNANTSPESLLVNRENSEVQLTLVSQKVVNLETKKKKKKKKTKVENTIRTVLVKTLKDERRARYREWVEANRRYVYEATEGEVGYLHIPDMGAFGFAEFHRYYLAESERAGLIVDVRFNGGGNVSQLLLEKLARRRLGYDQPRYGTPTPYPEHSVLGPIVTITNEFAGSDGDIFCHAFKLMGLGPLIGKRTWGGVIGIWPRHSLVDGTTTTQPEFSNWFEDVGWAVENYGTDPDIEVEITPQDYVEGKDPQLDQGLAEIKALMEQNPPKVPNFGPLPKLTLPTLPKAKDE